MPFTCGRITPSNVSTTAGGPSSSKHNSAPHPRPQMDTDRRTDAMAQEEAFVISDLHLGAGDTDPELEDFDQDDKFAEFVGQIVGPGVTLFINGDFIDFAQIPPYEVPKPHHLLWTEAASLLKVQRATDAHAQ